MKERATSVAFLSRRITTKNYNRRHFLGIQLGIQIFNQISQPKSKTRRGRVLVYFTHTFLNNFINLKKIFEKIIKKI